MQLFGTLQSFKFWWKPKNMITEFCSIALREALWIYFHEALCVEFSIRTIRHKPPVPFWGKLCDFFLRKIFILDWFKLCIADFRFNGVERKIHIKAYFHSMSMSKVHKVHPLDCLLIIVSVEEKELHVSLGQSVLACPSPHNDLKYIVRNKQFNVYLKMVHWNVVSLI